MKIYETMITKDYVPNWSAADGIREYVTNALDSSAPFEYQIDENSIQLTSVGVTLAASCLFMGKSGNRNNPEAVGTHGEGSLVGMVPILREGYSLTIYNGGVIWEPEFVYKEDLQLNVLQIKERPNNTSIRDYTVSIEGLDEDIIDTVVDNCTYLQKYLGRTLEGTKGKVFLDIPGKLYVGGVFVCEINSSKYSYDFKPQYLPLNRDRKQVNTWDLVKNTSELLEEVLPSKDIAEMVRDRVYDVGSSWYNVRPKSQSVAEESYKLFKETHGDDAIVTDSYQTKHELEEAGLENIVVISDDNYRQLIEESVEYQEFLEDAMSGVEKKEEDSRSPVEMLEEWYDKPYDDNSWDEFEKILDTFKQRGVEWET